MAYELSINRVMALCAFDKTLDASERRIQGKELVKLFYEQMDDIFKHRLNKIYSKLEQADALKEFVLKAQGGNARVAEPEIDIFKEARGDAADIKGVSAHLLKNADAPTTNRLVGRFQSRRFHFRTKSMKWDLRIRPSITACAVERMDGIAKLWWAFEGVPANSGAAARPTENEAVEFIKATNAIGEVALPLLRKAYVASLEAVTHRSTSKLRPIDRHIRVSIADNNGLPFAKLVDALFLKGASFADVRKGRYDADAAKGAAELVTFIEKTSGRTPDDSSIEINTALPGMAAVYCKLDWPSTTADGKRTLVAGLANSASMISAEVPSTEEWRMAENKPEVLRSVSAARPVSAVLANEGAKILDRELPAGAATLG